MSIRVDKKRKFLFTQRRKIMAGFSRLYCIGEPGGFEGADGLNPILLQILVGDADRQWLEAHYFDPRIRPIGNIKSVVPEGPDHPNALIDACLAFYPEAFAQCPSMTEVKSKLARAEQLDFHLGKNKIPQAWHRLRIEARGRFAKLHIFEAKLKALKRNRATRAR
jgi:hypothetical protein